MDTKLEDFFEEFIYAMEQLAHHHFTALYVMNKLCVWTNWLQYSATLTHKEHVPKFKVTGS